MHQHTTTGGSIKPTQVQNRFRFAGTKEIPFAIYPGFYPCMVVVGMSPTRSIYLSCRNTYRAKSCYGEGGFFTTATISGFYGSEWRTRAGITWGVDYLFVAPVVYLEYSVVQWQILHTVFQFIVKHPAWVIQVFIVYPNGEHKMTEYVIGDFFSPRHFPTCLIGESDIFQIVVACIIRYVTCRHVGIEEH